MKYLITVSTVIAMLTVFKANAQLKTSVNYLVSGQYEEVKLSCDSENKSFTGLIEDKEGNISCSLFFRGIMAKNDGGNYAFKAYPYGLMDTTNYGGTLIFRAGKNGHESEIKIQLSESGSCQNIINLKQGVFFSLEKIVSYKKFSMIRGSKAVAYTNNSMTGKKGYFIQGDFVSIISENKDMCYVEYVKKPTFKAWVKKSDLIL